MTWAPLLLADASACLRWLVLRDLFRLPQHDEEVLELAPLRLMDPLVIRLLEAQEPEGSWRPKTLAEGRAGSNRILSTALALTRLGFLGFDHSLPAVVRGAEYLFSQQQVDGSWPLHADYEESEATEERKERYTSIPLQTTFPLRSLASCGYAEDPRAESAYEWLLGQRLDDGTWPTGIASGVYGYVGGYRRLPHSRWGCRSNTTGALICLSLHPGRRNGPEAKRALDHLLARETRESYTLGFEVARLIGAEVPRGFITFFARFDLGLVIWLCSRVGAGLGDERVDRLVQFIKGQQGEYGLWDYPNQPQASRWVTFDLMRSLANLDDGTDWLNLEPSTPFRAYPKKQKRF